MKLFAIILTRHIDDVIFLCKATNLNAYSYIKKKAFTEGALFIARTVPSRIDYNSKETISHENNIVFAYKYADGICPIVITTNDYPERVAFYMINEIYLEFIHKTPRSEWDQIRQDTKINFDLHTFIDKYKDPLTCDAITQTNIKINDSIEKVRTSVDALLKNRENLDVLVDKSKDLSTSTKQLFKQSKKLKKNQCCKVM